MNLEATSDVFSQARQVHSIEQIYLVGWLVASAWVCIYRENYYIMVAFAGLTLTSETRDGTDEMTRSSVFMDAGRVSSVTY